MQSSQDFQKWLTFLDVSVFEGQLEDTFKGDDLQKMLGIYPLNIIFFWDVLSLILENWSAQHPYSLLRVLASIYGGTPREINGTFIVG